MTDFCRDNLFFVILTACYLALVYLMQGLDCGVLSFDPTLYLVYFDHLGRYALAFLAVALLIKLIRNFHKGLNGATLSCRQIRQTYLRADRVSGVVLLLTALPLFFYAYTSFKTTINLTRPFLFDNLFKDLDYLLHFSNHPWALLHLVFSREEATVFLDRLYGQGWFLLWICMFIWMAWTSEREIRWLFFANFALCWILLGTVMANLLSSAGPCYFDKVTGDLGPYEALFEHLRKIDTTAGLSALNGQAMLWQAYLDGMLVKGEGISAMPSMHLSMMTTCTLGAWSLNRVAGVIYAVMTGGLLVGSIYLGWHYAIDGYASIVLTGIIWALLRPVARLKYRKTITTA